MSGGECEPPIVVGQEQNFKVPPTVPWFERTRYRCLACGFICFARKVGERHQRECPEKGEAAKAKKEVISAPVHTCLDCGAKVQHSGEGIKSHLGKYHGGLSLGDYAAKHDLERGGAKAEDDGDVHRKWYDGCRYTCNTCSRVYRDRYPMIHHVKSYHGQSADPAEGFDAVESRMDCAVCGVTVVRSSAVIRQHLFKRHRLSVEEYEAK